MSLGGLVGAVLYFVGMCFAAMVTGYFRADAKNDVKGDDAASFYASVLWPLSFCILIMLIPIKLHEWAFAAWRRYRGRKVKDVEEGR